MSILPTWDNPFPHRACCPRIAIANLRIDPGSDGVHLESWIQWLSTAVQCNAMRRVYPFIGDGNFKVISRCSSIDTSQPVNHPASQENTANYGPGLAGWLAGRQGESESASSAHLNRGGRGESDHSS